VYGEIKTLLNQDKPSADDRIRQIKKLQVDNALDKGRIKTLVEERIESLGSKGAKGAREITKLADNFDVSLE
jgi:ribosomal protein S20